MRDLSKILTEADLVAIKALLAQQGPFEAPSPHEKREYPKVLYAPEFVLLQRLMQTHTDPIVRKEAKEKLSKTYMLVHDAEQELDYMEDGWKADLNELIIEYNLSQGVSPDRADPRQPHGREGRIARKDMKAQREQELRDIQRRYMELTGRRIENDAVQTDAVVPPPHEEEPIVEEPVKTTGRRVPAHIAASAKRATAPRQPRA